MTESPVQTAPAAAPVAPPKYRPTVAVDLDGTLAVYDRWRGLEEIGAPIAGAQDFVARLGEFADVLIWTTRTSLAPADRKAFFAAHPDLKTERQQREYLVGLVKAWLDRHGFAYHAIDAGPGKPLAACFVDDRSIECRPQTAGIAPQLVYAQCLAAARHLCDRS